MKIPIVSDGYRFIIPLIIITVALALSPYQYFSKRLQRTRPTDSGWGAH